MTVGTIATFYAADIAECCPNKDRRFDPKRESVQRQSQRLEAYLKINPSKLAGIGMEMADYSFCISDSVTIDAHPMFGDDVCYLGHFVNDRCRPDFGTISTGKYEILSKARANCEYVVTKSLVKVYRCQKTDSKRPRALCPLRIRTLENKKYECLKFRHVQCVCCVTASKYNNPWPCQTQHRFSICKNYCECFVVEP